MRVSEIGEFGLIRLLVEQFGIEYPARSAQPGLVVGLGDDAVVTTRHDGALVWTTDTLIAGVHFLPGTTDWQSVGWKALAVNLSDLAAMGATPHLALVTLMLPPDFAVEDAVAFYAGLAAASKQYGVTLGGGDIVRAPVFGATVALSGWAFEAHLGAQPRVMTRDAARVGDLVAVSGSVGDSAGGLVLLKDGADFSDPASQRLRAAHERPQPRLGLGKLAVSLGVRCAIDLSDGLVQDLGHIAASSGVEIRLDAARVPLSRELEALFPGRALGLGLSGGEDYELVLIGSPVIIETLLSRSEVPLTQVGEVVHARRSRVAVVDEMGREMQIRRGGWDHLADA